MPPSLHYKNTNAWKQRYTCSECEVLPEMNTHFDVGKYREVHQLYCPVCLKQTYFHGLEMSAIIAWNEGKFLLVTEKDK